MTLQEGQMIDGLVERVREARPASKDSEAEQRLQAALGGDPDALYVLAQTVIVQQYALDQAKEQLAEAREQIASLQRQPAPQQHTSFLGSLFGSGHQTPPPAPVVLPAAQQYAPVNVGSAYGQPPFSVQQTGGLLGGGGGFLQGALQTAAGVAAGEMAFRGIEDLMHGFGHAAGYGSDRMMGGGLGGPEVVNYYYDGGETRDHDSFGERLQAADGDSGISSDVEDRRGFLDGDDTNPAANDGTDAMSDGGDDSGSDFSANDDGSY